MIFYWQQFIHKRKARAELLLLLYSYLLQQKNKIEQSLSAPHEKLKFC